MNFLVNLVPLTRIFSLHLLNHSTLKLLNVSFCLPHRSFSCVLLMVAMMMLVIMIADCAEKDRGKL